VRDLGGLQTTDGRRVRSGRIFRSDYPGFAEQEGGEAVRELGLRSVVDLRRSAEAAHECVAWEDHGVAYHRWPIVADVESSWHARYPAYLSHRPDTVIGAVRCVLDPASHPVIFHCAAGKDRTGVVAALVLSALGVANSEIVDDYTMSDDSVALVLARLAEAAPYRDLLATTTVDAQRPKADAMAAFLEYVEGVGGAERWLVDHGMTVAEIDTAREGLLESPG
jgi:protein tyrosine/serine phosphatase